MLHGVMGVMDGDGLAAVPIREKDKGCGKYDLCCNS